MVLQQRCRTQRNQLAKSQNAEQLIHQLDNLAEEYRPKCRQVALVTPLGPIYSWQTHKLSNLEFALERGAPAGFVIAAEGEDYTLCFELRPIDVSDDVGPSQYHTDLIASIDEVRWALMCEFDSSTHGEEDEIDKDFRTEFKFCPKCNREMSPVA